MTRGENLQVRNSSLFTRNSMLMIVPQMPNPPDEWWPSKLQLACLSANIHRKRATGNSPFQLLFGRELNHLPLIRRLNVYNQILMKKLIVQDDQIEVALAMDNEIYTTDWQSNLEHTRTIEGEDTKCIIGIELTK
ncbi:hypothetical protein LOD99_11971 [Oopsacas minuta]|uniref:Uncharacterized protein n=1 Tax=Oopsacas minuta TaxID=111878 RepID=A0AAV7JH62_9METZ|nr:hypothetical protein LOD99_11971 [Oopsacas minuta]